jgi:hypothetical protein
MRIVLGDEGERVCIPTAPIVCCECGASDIVAVAPGSIAFAAAAVQYDLFGSAIGSVEQDAIDERPDRGWGAPCWAASWVEVEP